MPIQTDNTRLSIDFGYEQETTDGMLAYQLRFTHTAEGPVVMIASGDPSNAVELPAQMFIEVADFLISQGVMKGNRSVSPTKQNIGTGSMKPSIALPTISRKVRQNSPTVPDVEPLVSISNSDQEEETEPQDLQTPEINKEEEEQILRERAAAKARAAKSNKTIKKDHRPE